MSSWERGGGGGGFRGDDRDRFDDDRGPRRGGSGFGGGRGRFDDDDRGPRRGGYGDRYDDDRGPPRSRADDGPWVRGGGRMDDDFDRPPSRGSDGPDSWRGRRGGGGMDDDLPPRDREGGGASRPRLNLKPRSAPKEAGEGTAQSSLFGGAKPVDTAAREAEVLARKMEKVGVKDGAKGEGAAEGGEGGEGAAAEGGEATENKENEKGAASSAEAAEPTGEGEKEKPASEAGEATDEQRPEGQGRPEGERRGRRGPPEPTAGSRWQRDGEEDSRYPPRRGGDRDGGFGRDREIRGSGDRERFGDRGDRMGRGDRGGFGGGFGRRDEERMGGGGPPRGGNNRWEMDRDGDRDRGYPRRGGDDRRDDRGGMDRGPRGGWGGAEEGGEGGGPRRTGSLRRFAPPPDEDLSRGGPRGGYGGDRGGRWETVDRAGRATPDAAQKAAEQEAKAEAEAARKAEAEEKARKKAEEAAKRAAEEEARRKAKEDEVLRLKEEQERRKAEAAAASEVAAGLVGSGVKGKELVEKAKGMGGQAKGSALLGAVLGAQASDDALASLGWLAGAAYGPALKALLAGDAADQKEAVYAVQRVCEARGYPKVGDDPLIEKLFHGLYGADILDEAAFTGWRDDDREEGNKRKAVVQTTPWFLWLETADEDEDDEEDESDIEELNNI